MSAAHLRGPVTHGEHAPSQTQRAACEGKDKFESVTTAAKVARQMERARIYKSRDAITFNAYRCRHCNQWHIAAKNSRERATMT